MKTLVRIISLSVLLSIIFSRPVSLQEAQSVALNKFPHKQIERSDLVANDLYLTTFKDGGFVLSSADDGFPAVLGFSESSRVGENPAFDDMCKDLALQISSHKNIARPRRSDWDYQSNSSLQKESASSIIEPMITSKWNQSPYYNNKFPYFTLSGYTGQRPYVGCVAVVMGQLMNYYEHPQRGFGKRWYYSESTDSLLEAWYDTTWYDYAYMPDSLYNSSYSLTASQRELDEVSLFLYQCAVSVDMDLQPDGSSSAYEDMMYALSSYFDYNIEMMQKLKSDYSDTDWKQMIITELTAGRPIPYRGNGDGGGHAFLLDGYMTTTSTYYHFNWGWGGAKDGWFLLSALNPDEGYDFTDNQAAIFNIQPNSDDLTRYAYTGFEGIQAGWSYDGNNFYTITGEEDLVYGFSQNDQWLISPKIHIPNNDNATLAVYALQINSGSKQCKIMISETDTLHASFTTQIGSITPGATWSEYPFSLRSYKNRDVYFGIQYVASSGYIIFDDLSVWTPKVVIATNEMLPTKHQLVGTYPNPFNPQTTIQYELSKAADVEICVYDLNGRKLTTLFNGPQNAGYYKLPWNASAFSSGLYICSFSVDNTLIKTQKMLLVK